MNETKIRELCEKRGYTSRACRFQVIAEMLSISPEEAKQVETITRTIRQIFPKDEVGAKLEAQWHKPQYQHTAESEWDSVMKSMHPLA